MTLVEVASGPDHREAVASVLKKVEEAASLLEAEAPLCEQEGKLTDKAVDLIFGTGITNAYLPQELGGLGLYPGEAVPLLSRLAYVDGSIGWVGTIFVSAGLMVNYLSEEITSELFASGENIAFSAVSNGQAKAVQTDEGWRITGDYRYASGVRHAKFVFMPAMKVIDGAPVPPPAGVGFFLVPTSSLELGEGWDVLGLKATGSVDFAARDVLVPANAECFVTKAPLRGGRAASGGLELLIPIMHIGFALGITERLLDEMKPVANKKPPVPGAKSLGERDDFRIEYARKYIAAKAARGLVMDVMADIDETLRRGASLSTRQHSLLRAANIYAHDVTRDTANWAFQRGGGAALRAGTLQRAIRDALSGCQHFIASDAHYANIGFDLLGAPEGYGWLGLHNFGPLTNETARRY